MNTKKTPPESLLKPAPENDLSSVYKVLHDVRAPLISMQGLIMLFKEDIKDEHALHYLGMIEQTHARMVTIVKGLESIYLNSNQNSAKDEIDFNDNIQAVLNALQFLPESKDMQFNVDVQVKRVFHSEKETIQSILQNLIHNAILYRNRGKNSFVSVSVSEEENHLVLDVGDNGEGIQEDILPHIFKMFYRGNQKSKGSGLGLFIVQNAVEKLNGTITVESKLNSGTSFKILLPFR
jgi:signal transduction histidine kinase